MMEAKKKEKKKKPKEARKIEEEGGICKEGRRESIREMFEERRKWKS